MRQYSFVVWAAACMGGAALTLATSPEALAGEDDAPGIVLYEPSEAQDSTDEGEPTAPRPAGRAASGTGLGKRTAQAEPAAAGEAAAADMSEEAVPDAPPRQAPAAAPVPAAKVDADEDAGGESTRTGRSIDVNARKKGVFGAYRVRLSYAHPNFDDGLKYYDKLYGAPNWYPEFGADWFAWDWYATLGIGVRMGYYTADGHAAGCPTGAGGQPSSSCSGGGFTAQNIQQDPNGPTTLTLIPLQLLATFEFTPFDRKWLVVDGWVGLERLYYQEVRNQKAAPVPSTATPPPTTATPATGSTATPTPDTTLTNTGWKSSSVIGIAGNILLNPLDETSPDSMRQLGLGNVYLSPYMEIIRTLTKTGVSFGRSVYGIGFTFETVN